MFRYFNIILVLFLFSCKSDGELSMERGIHYYDWKMYNEAILEFNKSKFYFLGKRKIKNPFFVIFLNFLFVFILNSI